MHRIFTISDKNAAKSAIKTFSEEVADKIFMSELKIGGKNCREEVWYEMALEKEKAFL